MDIEKYKNWNEFDWEQELQLEDKKINAYTNKLSNFIDLPNEAEIIWKHLNLASALSPALSWMEADFELEEDIDELFFDGIEKKTNSNLYIKLGNLASEFSRIIAASDDDEFIASGMHILCLYGNIISKTLDIIELEGNEIPALKTALSKRIVSNINVLIGSLKKIIKNDPVNAGIIKNQIAELLKYREKILDIRYKCESAK